jgi:hypothetical protein
MSVGLMDRGPMAKKRGRPKTSERSDVTVRVDAELVNKAKHVVLARGLSLAEYLSELLRVPIERDFAKEMRRLAGDQREGKG